MRCGTHAYSTEVSVWIVSTVTQPCGLFPDECSTIISCNTSAMSSCPLITYPWHMFNNGHLTCKVWEKFWISFCPCNTCHAVNKMPVTFIWFWKRSELLFNLCWFSTSLYFVLFTLRFNPFCSFAVLSMYSIILSCLIIWVSDNNALSFDIYQFVHL